MWKNKKHTKSPLCTITIIHFSTLYLLEHFKLNILENKYRSLYILCTFSNHVYKNHSLVISGSNYFHFKQKYPEYNEVLKFLTTAEKIWRKSVIRWKLYRRQFHCHSTYFLYQIMSTWTFRLEQLTDNASLMFEKSVFERAHAVTNRCCWYWWFDVPEAISFIFLRAFLSVR